MATPMPSRAGVLVEAARPRTLPAAIAPVLVGTAAAQRPITETDLGRFALALVVALALQVAVNYANDLFDGVKGVDTPERAGPRRAVASGLVAPATMKTAMLVAFTVAGVAGLALAWLVGWELLLVGGLAIVAALGYSGGPSPYASRGLGELSVFVFFGVVATVGSQYVQDERIGTVALVASVPVGLVAVALLVVNNLRDIPTDERTGKRTLAVRLGAEWTRALYAALLAGAMLGCVAVALVAGSPLPVLALVTAPLAVSAILRVGRATGPGQLIGALKATAGLHLALAVTLSIGLVLAEVTA